MSSSKPLSLHLELKPSKRLRIYAASISLVLVVCVLVMAYELNQSFVSVIIECVVLFFLGKSAYAQCDERQHRYLSILKPFPKVQYKNSTQWHNVKVTGLTNLAKFVIIDYRLVGASDKCKGTLVVWKDAVQESDFRQLRALIKTGELYSID